MAKHRLVTIGDSITQGWGTFTAEHHRYDELPSHLVEKVRQEMDEDD